MPYYIHFTQYTPSDAQPATLYWKSQEGVDWREVKNLMANDDTLTAIIFNHVTGSIEQVTDDLSNVIPTGKSVLLTNSVPDGALSNYYIHNGTLMEIHIDALRNEKWEAIKLLRDSKSQGGTFVNSINKWFHTDPKSLTHYLGLNQQRMMGSYTPVMWKTMDGSFVKLNGSLLGEVSNQVINNEMMIFGIAEQHKSMMEAYPNPLEYTEEIMNTLWPQVYADTLETANV